MISELHSGNLFIAEIKQKKENNGRYVSCVLNYKGPVTPSCVVVKFLESHEKIQKNCTPKLRSHRVITAL